MQFTIKIKLWTGGYLLFRTSYTISWILPVTFAENLNFLMLRNSNSLYLSPNFIMSEFFYGTSLLSKMAIVYSTVINFLISFLWSLLPQNCGFPIYKSLIIFFSSAQFSFHLHCTFTFMDIIFQFLGHALSTLLFETPVLVPFLRKWPKFFKAV